MPKKLSKEEFVERARKVHGDKYDYSKAEYVNAYTKVCIICPEHGEFWQTPHGHLCGKGCSKCAGRLTHQEIIDKCIERHGNKYDYSKMHVFKIKDKDTFICPIHGEFEQVIYSHINGLGCPKCSKSHKKTTKEFIREYEEKFGKYYDFSKSEYINARTKMIVTCPKDGDFYITPHSLLSGCGCKKCGYEKAKEKTMISEEEIKKRINTIHNHKYDLSRMVYKGMYEKVEIICPIHGSFWIRVHNLVNGKQGCPLCKESKLEKHVAAILKSNNIDCEREKKFDWLGKQSLDFYLPKYNIAIECQGLQHFKSIDFFNGEDGLKKTIDRDITKMEKCKNHGIKILYYTNIKRKDYPYDIILENKELIDKIINGRV